MYSRISISIELADEFGLWTFHPYKNWLMQPALSSIFSWNNNSETKLRVYSFRVIWIKINRIIVHQRNQWIRDQSGFIAFFDELWSEWSWISYPDPDYPKERSLSIRQMGLQGNAFLPTSNRYCKILICNAFVRGRRKGWTRSHYWSLREPEIRRGRKV